MGIGVSQKEVNQCFTEQKKPSGACLGNNFLTITPSPLLSMKTTQQGIVLTVLLLTAIVVLLTTQPQSKQPDKLNLQVSAPVSATLTWQSVTTQSNILGYRVFYGCDPGLLHKVFVPASTNMCVLPSLEPGKTYFAHVRTVDNNMLESAPSEQITFRARR